MVQQTDIAYGNDPAQRLDLYQPASSGPHMLVAFVHGGSWKGGNKHVAARIGASLSLAGYLVASIEYRKVPQTTPAGEAGDVALAIGFLMHHSAAYGIAPAHFAVMGHSSGGHLVALLATDPQYFLSANIKPSQLAAMIALDGVFDISLHMQQMPGDSKVFGSDPALWPHISPRDLIAKSQVNTRFCLLHSDAARRFALQADEFAATLRSAGRTVLSATAPGLNHGQLVDHFSDPDFPMQNFTLSCLDGLPAPVTKDEIK